MIRGLARRFEEAHGVLIRDEAVRAAVILSSRYITGRQLPDKAVDLLDTAGARAKILRAVHAELARGHPRAARVARSPDRRPRSGLRGGSLRGGRRAGSRSGRAGQAPKRSQGARGRHRRSSARSWRRIDDLRETKGRARGPVCARCDDLRAIPHDKRLLDRGRRRRARRVHRRRLDGHPGRPDGARRRRGDGGSRAEAAGARPRSGGGSRGDRSRAPRRSLGPEAGGAAPGCLPAGRSERRRKDGDRPRSGRSPLRRRALHRHDQHERVPGAAHGLAPHRLAARLRRLRRRGEAHRGGPSAAVLRRPPRRGREGR